MADLGQQEQSIEEKAELWDYYQKLIAANGADGITDLLVQRDVAREQLAELKAKYETNHH